MENNKIENKVAEEIVKTAIENGLDTFTLLTGDAPKQKEIFNDKPVDITGTIDAPSRFAEIREFDQKKSHCLANLSSGTLELVVNEQSTTDKFTIKGKVIIGRIYTELGINSGKYYEPEQLAKALKLKRSIFENRLDHANIIQQLRSIKAKVKVDIEKAKDNNGNATDVRKQTVESNMPKAFNILVPLIEGQDPQLISLEVILEVNDGDIYATLESIDGAENIEIFRAVAVERECDKLKDKTTIIYV